MPCAAGHSGQPRVPEVPDRDRHPCVPLVRRNTEPSRRIARHHWPDRRPVRIGADRRFDASVCPFPATDDNRQRAIQSAGAGPAGGRPPPRGLRHARARRDRGSGAAHRYHEPGALFPAAPARTFDLLTLLAGPEHRPQELPSDGYAGPAADGHAWPTVGLGRVPAHGERPGQCGCHRGCHQDLVGCAPLPSLSHSGDAHCRRVHSAR